MTTETQNPEPKPFSLLASERFGGNFKGEPTQPQPEPIEASDETPELPEVEAVLEPVTDDVTEQAEPEEQGTEYNLSDFAQILGVDESALDIDDDGRVVFNRKIDGQSSRTTPADLMKIGQTWEAAEKRLNEAKEKSKAMLQEATHKSEQIQEQFAVAANLIQAIEENLSKETKSVDWAKLREDDPAEYSARQIEIGEKRKSIEKMKQDAREQYQRSVQANQEQSQQAMQQHLIKEQEILLQKLPEWKSDEVAKTEKSKIADYLIKEGFAKEDLAHATDHRLIIMARKAMLYEQGQDKNKVLEKKVLRVPKVIKPGSPKPVEQINRDKLKQQKDRLAATGSIDDALAFYKAKRQA
jgi:hypothetical protein